MEIEWTHFKRFQDIFQNVSKRFKDFTLTKAVNIVNTLNEVDKVK